MVVPPPTQPTTCPLHRDPASVCVQANTPVCASVCLCSTVGRWAPAVCHLPLLPTQPSKLEQGKSDQAASCLTFDPVKCALLGSISPCTYSPTYIYT